MSQSAKTLLIRSWTRNDIDYVTNSVEREAWGYTRKDVKRCWRYEPKGCFIAELQNKPVGHVFSIGYDETGWIGLLIVNPENRGKGIGTTLMKNAIDYLLRTGRETIRLEAAEKAVPLYKRLGFKEEFASLRFCKQLEQKAKKKLKRSKEMRTFPIQKHDIANVAKFDSKYFGANRLRILQSLHEDQPQHCFIMKEKQQISGYIMSRKIQKAHWIGPWVCKNSETAEKLLYTCINAIKENKTCLRLGMPILNNDGITLMKKLDFLLTSKSVRMVFGKRKHRGEVMAIYGIGGPEKG